MFRRVGRRLPRLAVVWADSAYRAEALAVWVKAHCRWVIEVVTRRDGAVGFEVQPWRWVVERTFGWLTRWRRLNRNYEHTLESSKAVVQVALIGIMARRLAKTHK